MNTDKINQFQSALSLQNEKYEQKLERKEYQQEVREKFELEQKVLDNKMLQLKTKELKNDTILNSNTNQGQEESKVVRENEGSRMSKKRRKKMEKIANDETLNEKEKKAILDQIKFDGMGEKRVKRSKMGDFKDQSSYITTERPID